MTSAVVANPCRMVIPVTPVVAVPQAFPFTSSNRLRFNPFMSSTQIHYVPTFDPAVIGQRLEKLLVPGQIGDSDLDRRIARLDERFRTYAALSAHGLWTPGLAITREMRLACEAILPLEEIDRAFRRLFSISLKFAPTLPIAVLQNSSSWLEFLHYTNSLVREANPARLLRRLLDDGEFRSRFLFSLFLPRHFGGGFDRYPEQSAFLRSHLKKNGPTGTVHCLDAACGSGEGTYELAMLLLECGADPEKIAVHGVTVEPLELFAAAHGWFPHDPARQTEFRRRFDRIISRASGGTIGFFREDLTGNERSAGEEYDIILCNGLLGGPLLHDRETMKMAVGSLCARLRPSGILLAADCFHGGWKRAMPEDVIRETLAGCGLQLRAAGKGVAGAKTG